jgi:nucleotide-binding universal stress UspA family protein
MVAANVILAIRIGPESEAPTRVAARIARELNAVLTVVYVAMELQTATVVASSGAMDEDALREEITRTARDQVLDFVNPFAGGLTVDVVIVEGELAEAVTRVAAERNADFLVVGTKGRGPLSRLVLGDTAHDIIRRTPCPVIVVPRTIQPKD